MDKVERLIEQHYVENYPKLSKFVSRIIDYDDVASEDIVQNAYLKALSYKDSFSKFKGEFGKWFMTILFNCIVDYKMGDKGYIVSDLELDLIESEFSMYKLMESSDIKKMIDLESRKDYKRILESFYIKGYTSKEIHYTLGYSPTKIRKVCSLFRKRISDVR